MKTILSFIPTHVLILLKRLGIVLLMLYTTRLIFLLFNLESFQNLGFVDFLYSLWFDMITIGLFFLPYYFIFLLPIPIRGYKFHRVFFKTVFHVTTILLLSLNLMDVEYFRYTSKRSTFDLFSLIGAGNDFQQLIVTFISDFWYLIFFLIVLIVISEYLFRKTQIKLQTFTTIQKNFYKQNIIAFLVAVPLLFIIGRGGFSLKPTGIIEASLYSKSENMAFILPTAFTMIKTIDQGSLEQKTFYSDKECELYFNPIKTSSPQNILPDGTNVVILMLESFGMEFIGAYQNGSGYTPFLDSISKESLFFNHAFANGKKSIEAFPAVVASMPTLMDDPYISSPYGNNKINTLPNILAKHGYESAFYHGATNGSMRFDGFSAICGFDRYYGRYEYDNDEHFDKTWGILDEYFNPWTAKKLSKMKEPFFGMLFTCSSHHPYFIPEHMKKKVKNGPQPICASISYSDHALKLFFDEAKKQPWFDNTLFVIVADHTPGSTTVLYNMRTHLYRIPTLFYNPGGKLKAEKTDEIFQQLDIMPTILDLLNIETNYYSFGNSYYDNTDKEMVTYLGGTYYYFRDRFMTSFVNERARNLYDFTAQSIAPVDSMNYYLGNVERNEKRLRAIIQRYNRDLILNQTTVNEKKNTLHNKSNLWNR